MSVNKASQDGEGKRKHPKIFLDKKGNRYVKDGNKRIVARAGVTDAAFLKWLIKRFVPKRKKRAPRAAPKAASSAPVHSSSASANDDLLQDEGYRNYKNNERKQMGLPTVDAPVALGGPARISAEEQEARAERKRKREEEKAKLVEEKKEAETKAAKHESGHRAKAEKMAWTRIRALKGPELRHFIPDEYKMPGRIELPATEPGGPGTRFANTHSEVEKLPKEYLLHWLRQIKAPRLIALYNEYLQDEMKGSGRAGVPPGIKTPMSTSDIDEVMRGYRPKYLGCVARDGWDDLTAGMPVGKSGWIMNTDKKGMPGQHWVAFLLDLDGHTIEYYDSFADPMPADVHAGLKKFLALYGPHREMLKYKENRIPDQQATTANCGWFACRFLIDRFRGRSFSQVTQFDDTIKGEAIKGEAAVEKFKAQHGGSFNTYL